jgi:hypothetical protein
VYPGVDTLFKQENVTVELGGRQYACLYYPVAAHAVAGLPRIAAGDWVQHRREREAA